MTGHERLVGREAQVAELGAFLEELALAAAVCLLEGEAGIGKTTLWSHTVETAASRGYRVLACRPVEPESQLSYSGIGDLLAEAAPSVLPALPAPQARALEAALLLGDPGGEPPSARAVAVGMLGVIQRLAQDAPVIVAVDDVQWLDGPSAAALSFAARRLESEAIGLLLAVRTSLAASDPGFDVDRWPLGDRLRRIRLGPLSLGALRAIVHAHTGLAPTRPLLRRLHEVSGGNPFFAVELARAMPPEAGDYPELRVPSSLHRVVRDRLARLPRDEIEVLRVAAALSHPTLELVGRVLGREPAVAEAVAAGVIDAPGDPVRFTHPLLASSVSSGATAGEQRALHLRLASVVSDEEQAARHLALAAAGPDAAAAAVLERAAATVRARGTADAAAELAEQAVQLTPAGERSDLHRRRLAAATYYFDAGASEQASALLREALGAATGGRERAEVLLELGILRSDLGRPEDAVKLIEDALSECDDDALSATAHLNLAWINVKLAGAGDPAEHAWAAVRRAERLEDPALVAQALASTALERSGWRLDPVASAALARGIALERDSALNLPLDRRPTFAEALRLRDSGELEAARVRLERLVQLGREAADSAIIGPLAVLAEVDRAAGRFDAALRGAVEASDIAEQVSREQLQTNCLLQLAWLEAMVGRADDARGHAEQALGLAERFHQPMSIAVAGVILAFIEGSLGDLDAAMRWLDPALPRATELATTRFGTMVEIMLVLIELLTRAGRPEQASRLIERLQANTDTEAPPFVHAILEHCAGAVRAAQEDLEGARIALERALEHHGAATAWPFNRGLTLLELGRVQRRLRRRRDARATLELALSIFDELGTPLWARRARAEIARIGGRTGADGLTPAEQKIASLVAAGRSNREVAAELFVTVRTVETALTRIYRKLGVRSRTELARKFAESG